MSNAIQLPYHAKGNDVYRGDAVVAQMRDDLDARHIAVELNNAYLDGKMDSFTRLSASLGNKIPVTGTIGGGR